MAAQSGMAVSGVPWHGIDGIPRTTVRQHPPRGAWTHLPPPGRDGLAMNCSTSSSNPRRPRAEDACPLSRRSAGRWPSEHTDLTVLRGEETLAQLIQRPAERDSCLAGTMSLQGVDVAGQACQLVVIDKIPFPRPDDPVSRARSMDVGTPWR